MCNNITVFLLLLLGAWTKAEDRGVDTLLVVAQCDHNLVQKVQNHKKSLEEDQKLGFNQLEKNLPWTVVEVAWEEKQVKKIEFTEREIELYTPDEPGSKALKKARDLVVDWKALLRGDTSNNLNLYVWEFQPIALVFGYYLCTAGESHHGENKPHIGFAVNLGTEGGLSSEALDTLHYMKGQVKSVFGVKNAKFTKLSLQ